MLFFETDKGKLYNEDCRDTLDRMENESIDLVVTSPPYNVGIKYDVHNDLMDPKEYYLFIRDIFNRLYHKLKIGGRIAINIPYEVNFKKQDGGREFLSAQYWSILKSIGYKWGGLVDLEEDQPHRVKYSAWGSWLSPSAPYIYNPKECVILCCREQWKKINKGTSYFTKENKQEFIDLVTSGWKYRAETRGLTEANFSLDIPVPAIKLLTWKEDLVYDPFMGSGTTASACETLERRWIGSEISGQYCDVAKRRLIKQNAPELFFE